MSGGGQGVISGGPGTNGAVGVATDAAVETLFGDSAVDVATGVGEVKLGYDFVSYVYGLYKCK